MSTLFYFAIITFQFTSSLATRPIPLKCFLRENIFFNSFSTIIAPHYDVPLVKPPLFGIVRASSNNFDKHGWKLNTSNLEFHGLDDAILDDFGFNFVTNVSQITLHTDMLVTYNYKSSGSLFSIPIYGEGFTQVPLKNIQIAMTIPFDFIEVNGNKFIELRNFNYWYDIKDNAEFSFSNLYYGNKELSDKMHCHLNENWKFIVTQFGKGFIDHVAEHIFNVFRNYMLSMPLKDFSTC